MGKQINFYMSEKVQAEFIVFLKENQFEYYDYYANKVEEPTDKKLFEVYIYKMAYGEIVKKEEGRVLDSYYSPVIEFSKTIVREDVKEIIGGRLWMTDLYFDEKGNKAKKEEVFTKDYQKLVRWIKKHVPYQEYDHNGYLYKDYINDEIIQLYQEGYVFTK